MESRWLSVTNCTKSLDNLISKNSEKNAICMTEIWIFERLVLVSGWCSEIKFTSMPSAPTHPPLILQIFLDRPVFFKFSPCWLGPKNVIYVEPVVLSTLIAKRFATYELHTNHIVFSRESTRPGRARNENFSTRISHSWADSSLQPVSPLIRAKSGKIGHFQTFEVWTFVPAIFWFLVVCMVKMWSDRKKK